jgi:predicted ATP-grasp superfamily ATP-dependent carboligase
MKTIEVGLSESFDRVHPILWICNIGAEKFWNDVNLSVTDSDDDKIVNRIEEINLLLCRKQDYIILREKPDPDYLDYLCNNGFELPRILTPSIDPGHHSISEIVLMDLKLQEQLKQITETNKIVYFLPYAVTQLEEKISSLSGLHLIGADSNINKMLNNKILNRKISKHLGFATTRGQICKSIEEVKNFFYSNVIKFKLFKKIVLKDPHGASGRGLYIIENEKEIDVLLKRQSSVLTQGWLVEGWYETKKDLNYQIYVNKSGSHVFSIKEQILNEGVYVGSKFPALLAENVLEDINLIGQKIGDYLQELGFVGVAGVDSIITSENELIPIIEINARFTLSTYISFIGNRFGTENKYYSRYTNLMTKNPLKFNQLIDMLNFENLSFNRETNEGIFIYNAGALPSVLVETHSYYIGRLFVIIVGRNWEFVKHYSNKLDLCINKINVIRY